jgi:hypothetical protein
LGQDFAGREEKLVVNVDWLRFGFFFTPDARPNLAHGAPARAPIALDLSDLFQKNSS